MKKTTLLKWLVLGSRQHCQFPSYFVVKMLSTPLGTERRMHVECTAERKIARPRPEYDSLGLVSGAETFKAEKNLLEKPEITIMLKLTQK